MHTPLTQFDAAFNLLLLVTAIALVARRFRVPYTVALIFAGLTATLRFCSLPSSSRRRSSLTSTASSTTPTPSSATQLPAP